MFSRMLLAYSIVGKTFGKWIQPLFTGWMFFNLWFWVSVGLALDPLFFPKLRKTDVKSPIVVVGNPRTGTTFLQRYLVDHEIGAGTRLWHELIPSLTLQKLLNPFIPQLERFSPAKHHTASVHKTSLTSVETDDPALFFRFFDGFFLFGFVLAHAEKDYTDMFDPNKRDFSARDFAYLRQVWRRNLVTWRRDRVVSKLFSLGARVNPFIKEFPDARLLYMIRDPLSMVPSGISLVTGVQEPMFGFSKLSPERQQHFIEGLYDGFLQITRLFHDDWVAGRLPRENIMLVHFDRMMSDFDGLMDELLPFIGHEPSPELIADIKATAEKQRAYKSGHKYSLEKYGLTAERIKKDYAFFYETFGVTPAE
ncbi:MAG: sulfotransferase [Pseudomonadota bacterium]